MRIPSDAKREKNFHGTPLIKTDRHMERKPMFHMTALRLEIADVLFGKCFFQKLRKLLKKSLSVFIKQTNVISASVVEHRSIFI